MSSNLYGSICLTDIPKQYITTGRNGKKYIAVNIWENREGVDRFGNSHSIQVSVPADERQKDNQKYYIGNLKTRTANRQPENTSYSNGYSANMNTEPTDDLPF